MSTDRLLATQIQRSALQAAGIILGFFALATLLSPLLGWIGYGLILAVGSALSFAFVPRLTNPRSNTRSTPTLEDL